MITLRLLLAFFVMTAATGAQAACRDLTYLGNSYTLCEVAADQDLRLWNFDAEGNPYGHFSALNTALDGQLGFAMNAGMFHDDYRPVGLHIEDGEQSGTLSDGGGYGNFGLTPNGVFCIRDTRFDVIESEAFKTQNPTCRFATQSGPMLVIDGQLHPRFLPDSTSTNLRNGVGTTADGQIATFVISNNSVTFHEFASLFPDHLRLPQALFFDGSVSRLHAPDLGRSDLGRALGPIVGTVIPKQ